MKRGYCNIFYGANRFYSIAASAKNLHLENRPCRIARMEVESLHITEEVQRSLCAGLQRTAGPQAAME